MTNPNNRARFRSIVLPVFIVLSAIGFSVLLISFKKEAEKVTKNQVVIPVRTIITQPDTEQIAITVYGEVESENVLPARFEISGRVVKMHRAFTEGGIIPKGDIIAEIDPRDYELNVESAEAELKSAQARYDLESGNRNVARREFELLRDHSSLSKKSKSLALREPQLKEKIAEVKRAQSRLDAAQLALERTKLIAPFSGLVTTKSISVGTYVTPQQEIGTLVDTEAYRVVASVPVNDLQFFEFSDPLSASASATIYDESIRSLPSWSGFLRGISGALDDKGKMSKLIVTIEDPLSSKGGKAPLQIGSFVKVVLEGKELENVLRIPRYALRAKNQIWTVTDESQLQIIPVSVVYSTEEDTYIRVSGVRSSLEVITSLIAVPKEGMAVRSKAPEPPL